VPPSEIKPIISSLISLSQAIEDLRSDKTIFHGKTDDSSIVADSIYSKLVVIDFYFMLAAIS